MPSFLRPLIALLALLCASLTAYADTPDKAVFEQRYEDMRKASDDRDRDAMMRIFAEGFVSIDIRDTRMTADQVIGMILAAPKDLSRNGKTDVVSVTVENDTATVVQTYHATSTRKSSDGVSHAIEVTARSRDIWVKKDGVWLLNESRTDEITMKADGRILAHDARM